MRVIPGRGWLLASIPDYPANIQRGAYRTEKINQWCESQFGQCGVRWYADQRRKIHNTWRFRDECDLMMFLLTWG